MQQINVQLKSNPARSFVEGRQRVHVRANLISSAETGAPKTSLIPITGRRSSHKVSAGNGTSAVADKEMAVQQQPDYEQAYLSQRGAKVNEQFPGSLGLDDFIHRLEIGLFSYGFNGENSIACTNLCRDEITCTLRNKIDLVFGNSFNVNGLGGVLTTGVAGVGAGLSHSPVDVDSGKERYVFFSFPHIAFSPYHEPGVLCRPGRPGKSSACGALLKALSDLKEEGLGANCKTPGVHEPENPEYSILKQRLARLVRKDGKSEADVKNMTIVDLTKVAERAITADLEFLISKAVDPKKADYAVVTGIQVHSWAKAYGDDTPNLEYVQPCVVYTVVNGQKTALDLNKIPALTPRQLRELTSARTEGGKKSTGGDDGSTLRSAYYVSHKGQTAENSNRYKDLLEALKNGVSG
jgi:hypothetical protein